MGYFNLPFFTTVEAGSATSASAGAAKGATGIGIGIETTTGLIVRHRIGTVIPVTGTSESSAPLRHGGCYWKVLDIWSVFLMNDEKLTG